jgi:DNA-binding Lrp family transcriptional regulator
VNKYQPGTFSIIPNKTVVAGQKAFIQSVYFWICDMANEEGKCWPSHETLAIRAGCSESSVKRAIATLEEIGILTRENRKTKNGQTSNIYQLNIVPVVLSELAGQVSETYEQYPSINNNKPSTKVEGINPEEIHTPDLKLKTEEGVEVTVSGELLDYLEISPDVDDLTTNKLRKPMGNPDVNELIDYFEVQFDLKMSRPGKQRIAASNLIRRYQKENVKKGIDAALLVRDEEYAPQIVSLEDLWEKWNKLAEFYRKRQGNQSRVTILEDED